MEKETEQVKSCWIDNIIKNHEGELVAEYLECLNCGVEWDNVDDLIKFKYCFNCGAKME